MDTDIISKLFWYNHSDNVDDGLREEGGKEWKRSVSKLFQITQVRANENLNQKSGSNDKEENRNRQCEREFQYFLGMVLLVSLGTAHILV